MSLSDENSRKEICKTSVSVRVNDIKLKNFQLFDSTLEIVPDKIFTVKKLDQCSTAYDICDTDGNLVGLAEKAEKQRPNEILKSRS